MDGVKRTGARAESTAADGAETAPGPSTDGTTTAPGTSTGGATAATPRAHAAAPRTPRIGLVTFGPHRSARHRPAQHSSAWHGTSSAAALLLDDAADALVAYARMAAREAGLDTAVTPEFVRTSICPADGAAHDGSGVSSTGATRERRTAAGQESAAAKPPSQSCSALVFAIDAPAAVPMQNYERACSAAFAMAEAGARVYAIVTVPGENAADGERLLQHLTSTCAGTGCRWSGGLVVTDAELIPRLMRAPRLGAWRRPVSETIDTLVAAIRLNCSLNAVDDLLEGHTAVGDSGDHLIASPNHLWRSVARRIERQLRTRA